MHNLITIVIPMYNEENYIKGCIESALNQTITDIKIIILDNCSTDKSAQIIKDIHDERVKYIKNESNIGAYSNMNKALDICESTYITILKADDKITPSFLEDAMEAFKRHPNASIVHGEAILFDKEEKLIRPFHIEKCRKVEVEYKKGDYLLQFRQYRKSVV